MTSRAPTARAIEVPHLVGVKADEAIQRLRELGLMPITWSADVDDVKDAGRVLGLDPPAGSPVRPKSSITMSVAAHPDFKGHTDEVLDAAPESPVQTPLTWPLSGPTGFAAPAPAPTSEALADASPTAAAPGAPSAPASPPLDAAYREVRHDAAAPSSAGQPTPGVAADHYLHDVSAPVPTPDEISAGAEWDRLRETEAARHAAGQSFDPEAQPTAVQSAVVTDKTPEPDSAEALEQQARREARRRSARRHRRLTRGQKAIVGGVLALTLFIAAAAMSGDKPVAHPPASTHIASRRAAQPAPLTTAPATVAHKRAKAHTPRVVVRRRTPTRVVRIKVHTPAPTTPQANHSAPSSSASAAPSSPARSSTGAGGTSTTTGGSTSRPAASTPSHQPASTPSSADSHSSGTGGGSTLQSPDGSTAPPQP
jgi:hypothetical protein